MGFVYPPWRGLSVAPHIRNARLLRDRFIDGRREFAQIPPVNPGGVVDSLAVVAVYYGGDASRKRSALLALEALGRSSPLPRYILAEGVFPGDAVVDWPPFVEVFRVHLPELSRGVWLKESLLDMAIGKALADTGTEHLLLLDTDSAFADTSWAVMVSDALSQYDIIHPAILLQSLDGCPFMDNIPRPGEKALLRPFPPYCSIGITRSVAEAVGKLPKSQWRDGDQLLIAKLDRWGLRYGTAYQTLIHFPHLRKERPAKARMEYIKKEGREPLGDTMIDWSMDTPVWVDMEARRIFLGAEGGCDGYPMA